MGATALLPAPRRPRARTVTAPVPPGPSFVSAAAVELVGRASASLREAGTAGEPVDRFVGAHLAALRAAAAVLAARGRPPSRRRGPLNVWDALGRVAPELDGWLPAFTDAAARRAALEAGRGAPLAPGEADAHLQRAEAFTAAVADLLGAPQPAQPLPRAAS